MRVVLIDSRSFRCVHFSAFISILFKGSLFFFDMQISRNLKLFRMLKVILKIGEKKRLAFHRIYKQLYMNFI